MDYETPSELKAFLNLCLDPPGGPKRTVAKLVAIMPDDLTESVCAHVPELAAVQDLLTAAEAAAAAARATYARLLEDWLVETTAAPSGVTE
ncbi:hypothetical protein OG216_19635 [Streptomycetaceae bacterium NBC_01309]